MMSSITPSSTEVTFFYHKTLQRGRCAAMPRLITVSNSTGETVRFAEISACCDSTASNLVYSFSRAHKLQDMHRHVIIVRATVEVRSCLVPAHNA